MKKTSDEQEERPGGLGHHAAIGAAGARATSGAACPGREYDVKTESLGLPIAILSRLQDDLRLMTAVLPETIAFVDGPGFCGA